MEENNKLSHQMPTWNNTRNPTNSQQVIHPPPRTATRASRSPNGYEEEEDDEEERDTASSMVIAEETGRERLKRHREEVKGRVKIPEDWGQEKMMKEWIDYTTFDALFAPHTVIVAARDALIADGRKTTSSSAPPRSSRSQRLRIYSQ